MLWHLMLLRQVCRYPESLQPFLAEQLLFQLSWLPGATLEASHQAHPG